MHDAAQHAVLDAGLVHSTVSWIAKAIHLMQAAADLLIERLVLALTGPIPLLPDWARDAAMADDTTGMPADFVDGALCGFAADCADCADCEDGGAIQMYSSVLKAQVLDSEDPALQAFKHFLQKHVEFDNEEGAEAGHGTLVRKFEMEDKHIGPFWNHFADFLETLVYGEKAEEPAQATVSF